MICANSLFTVHSKKASSTYVMASYIMAAYIKAAYLKATYVKAAYVKAMLHNVGGRIIFV